MKKPIQSNASSWCLMLGGSLVLAASAHAGMVTDGHGNVGYDTATECDAAVAAGTARYYEPFTHKPALKRGGEVDVKTMKLNELVAAQEAASQFGYSAAGYAKGACDLGVGHSGERDGVSPKLIGKYVPYSPEMSVNGYLDQTNKIVRATMQQCDNNFSRDLPRPVGSPAPAPVAAKPASECFADVLTPAKFEPRTEQVVKIAATKRYEVVPATYKTVSEQVLVTPEIKKQIPVPGTYKTATEDVVVKPAGTREEPVPATYKTVSEQVMVKVASKRLEVVPGTYKTVTEEVLITPERKEIKIIPAVYSDTEESVIDRPATTRVETVPGTYKTETEQVLTKAESIRYEPIVLPLRKVSEEVVRTQASAKLAANKATYRTVTERVVVKEASKRLETTPAVFETITECVKVADATREWKRGRAWIGKAADVRPLRGFVVEADGRVDGSRVEVAAAAGGRLVGVVDKDWVVGNNSNLDDDVMCLVDIPEKCEAITRQIVKTPAAVREVEIPAEYATVTRQVLDREASTSEVEIPATYQTVSHQEIDLDKLRALGYRIDDKGDISATPAGERVLRAATVMRMAGGAASGSSGSEANKSAGAQSGEEAYVREIKIPAEYRSITRQVVDKSALVRTVEVPATYITVKTRVVTTPASTEEIVTPAVYKTVSRQVVDTPASTLEISIPAEYKMVERRVIDTPATTRPIPIAAVTETIKRRVVDTPASFREEVTPAVYKTETRKIVDQPATTREIDIPAQYETLSYQVKTAEPNIQRRSVLCETNATPAKIMEIQSALQQAGYNPGAVNGVLRAETMSAVNQYQQAKGLPVDGFLNIETVKALGVSPSN